MKNKTINWLHLLWIIPLCILLGMVTYSLIDSNSDKLMAETISLLVDENHYWKYRYDFCMDYYAPKPYLNITYEKVEVEPWDTYNFPE